MGFRVVGYNGLGVWGLGLRVSVFGFRAFSALPFSVLGSLRR